VLVEAVEEGAGDGQHLLIVGHHRQAPADHVEPGCLGGVVAVVGQIGLVHHAGDVPEDGIVEVVAAQDRLEAAVVAVVGQLDAAHVERGGVGRNLERVVDEDEGGLGVDEASDQPRAGGAVYVAVGPRRPPTRAAPGCGRPRGGRRGHRGPAPPRGGAACATRRCAASTALAGGGRRAGPIPAGAHGHPSTGLATVVTPLYDATTVTVY